MQKWDWQFPRVDESKLNCTFISRDGKRLGASSVILEVKSSVLANLEYDPVSNEIQSDFSFDELSTFFSLFVDFDQSRITRNTVPALYRLAHQYEIRDLERAVEQFMEYDAEKAPIDTLIQYWGILTIYQLQVALSIGKEMVSRLKLFMAGRALEQDMTEEVKEMLARGSTLKQRRMNCFLYLMGVAGGVDIRHIRALVCEVAPQELVPHVVDSTDIPFLYLLLVQSLNPRSRPRKRSGIRQFYSGSDSGDDSGTDSDC